MRTIREFVTDDRGLPLGSADPHDEEREYRAYAALLGHEVTEPPSETTARTNIMSVVEYERLKALAAHARTRESDNEDWTLYERFRSAFGKP
jgi:hypothetical protein